MWQIQKSWSNLGKSLEAQGNPNVQLEESRDIKLWMFSEKDEVGTLKQCQDEYMKSKNKGTQSQA